MSDSEKEGQIVSVEAPDFEKEVQIVSVVEAPDSEYSTVEIKIGGDLAKSLTGLMLVASLIPSTTFKREEPCRTTQTYCKFLPLNFLKYTDQKVFIEDGWFSDIYRPLLDKYENTDNVLLSVHAITGMWSGSPFDQIKEKDIEKEEHFICVVSMAEFDQLPKKIDINTTPFKFEEPECIEKLGEFEILDLIDANTYEWGRYLTKKDYIRFDVYHLSDDFYRCDICVDDKKLSELIKKSPRLKPKNVFNFDSLVYDDDLSFDIQDIHDSEFMNKKRTMVKVDRDGNKLKKPIPRFPNQRRKRHS